MKNMSKIAVIGGTGRAGSCAVNRLIEKGYSVRLLLRNPGTYTPSSAAVEVVKGSATDAEAIRTLLQGCTAVLSTLGQRKGEEAPFSLATGHILQAMHEQGIRRYIVITGLSIDLPADRKGVRTRLLSWLMRKSFADTIADKQKEAGLLINSTVDWTLVRLPRIKVPDVEGEIGVDVYDCPGKEIGSRNLARFLVEQLESRAYVRQAPFVANV